uniref:Auxin-induced protein 6B n=2 Tax=Cajanus cajan TaxID=3821 RepID=A0A151TV41_CAJCA|nr:Auxin-induced protein 6B [Cajanus cajan]
MLKSCVQNLQKSFSLFVHFNKDQVEEATLVPDDVMEGHFVVLAMKGEETRRFVVKLDYLTDPMFMDLLNQAREEYGFRQKGALAVPCRPQELQNILDVPRAKAPR